MWNRTCPAPSLACLAAWLLVGGAGCGETHQNHADAGAHHGPEDLRAARDLEILSGPALLSETGLYADFKGRSLAPGVIRFTPRFELWSDGAEKERYLLLPPGTKIDTSDMDQWAFPLGTRAWKQFVRGGRVIETRLLQKVHDLQGGWFQMAYAWDGDGSEARAVPLGQPDSLGTPHDVPSQEDCTRCHENVRDVLIGVSAIQLSDGGKGSLSKLAAAGLLSHPPASEFRVPGAGNVQAALGYLHGNCGHCHNGRNEFQHPLKMRLWLTVADRVAEESPVYRTTIGTPMAHTMPGDIHIGIVPGSPEKSQLFARMSARDDWSMPPVCTELPDEAGRATLREWIKSLK